MKPGKIYSRQQISVRLKKLLHEAFRAGLSAADVSEAVNGSLGSVLAERRKFEPYRRQAARAVMVREELTNASEASEEG
jgi:hypothetical protein